MWTAWLTDGSIYYGNAGEELKAFNIKDGLGIKLLQRAGIGVAIITGRQSDIVERRARELGIADIIQGREDKLSALTALCGDKGISLDQCAYMGDDLPDLAAISRAGLGLTVSDAVEPVKQSADWGQFRTGWARRGPRGLPWPSCRRVSNMPACSRNTSDAATAAANPGRPVPGPGSQLLLGPEPRTRPGRRHQRAPGGAAPHLCRGRPHLVVTTKRANSVISSRRRGWNSSRSASTRSSPSPGSTRTARTTRPGRRPPPGVCSWIGPNGWCCGRHVVLTHDQTGTRMDSNALDIDLRTRTASSKQKVVITQGQNRTTADGLYADLDRETLELKPNVESIYVAPSEPDRP